MNRHHNKSNDVKIAGLYDLEDTLGRGHFAVVKLAKHVFTGEKVAVKVIDKSKLDEISRAHLFQEVRCMKLVQHPNVVRLYEVIDTQTKLYLILELGDGGDLYDYIMKHEKGLDEEMARKYFQQIVHAISYCHQLHVVHRDLKPENVVFFEKLRMVKLTDFGFSNRFCPGQKLETSCGSLAYSAPEILLGDSYDAPAVDIWSLGVILYMLVCGQAPFQEVNDSETLTMIMDCKYTIPCYISQGCRSLIGKMLIRDPEKRATLEDIANNEWLRRSDDLQPADYLPLVSREHLQEDDHAHIIQKMVNGNIADKEAILEALDKNSYDHITATYYLLAERKLRAQRHLKAQNIQAENRLKSNESLSPQKNTQDEKGAVNTSPPISPLVMKTQTSTEQLSSPSLLTPPITIDGPHSLSSIVSIRKCSIVCEEDEENVSQASSRQGSLRSCISTPDISSPTKKLAAEIDSENKSSSNSSSCASSPMSPKVPFGPHPASQISPTISPSQTVQFQSLQVNSKFKSSSSNRRLHAVKSSPQLVLNEICEEGESDLDSNNANKTPATSPTFSNHMLMPSQDVMHRFEQRLVATRAKIKARTASCSSSEASDDDSENRKRSKHGRTHQVKPLPKRDHSHDDSSDSQDQGACVNGPKGSNRGRTIVRTHVPCSDHGNSSENNGKQDNNSSKNRSVCKSNAELKHLTHSKSVAGIVLNSSSNTVTSRYLSLNEKDGFDSTDSILLPEVRRLSYQDDESILAQLYSRDMKLFRSKAMKNVINSNNLSGSVSVDSNLCGSNRHNYGFNFLRDGLKFSRKTNSSNGLNRTNSKIYKLGSLGNTNSFNDKKPLKILPNQIASVSNHKLDINQNGLKKSLASKKKKASKNTSLLVDPSSKCCSLS